MQKIMSSHQVHFLFYVSDRSYIYIYIHPQLYLVNILKCNNAFQWFVPESAKAFLTPTEEEDSCAAKTSPSRTDAKEIATSNGSSKHADGRQTRKEYHDKDGNAIEATDEITDRVQSVASISFKVP